MASTATYSATEGPDRGYKERDWCTFFSTGYFLSVFSFFSLLCKNLFISPLNAIRCMIQSRPVRLPVSEKEIALNDRDFNSELWKMKRTSGSQ